MKHAGSLAISIGVALGCQGGSGGGDNPAYVRDVERICHVVERAGVTPEMDANDRQYVTATWLGANVESPEGRALLAALQPLSPGDKALALTREAARAGLAGCPTADAWRK